MQTVPITRHLITEMYTNSANKINYEIPRTEDKTIVNKDTFKKTIKTLSVIVFQNSYLFVDYQSQAKHRQ